MDFFALPDVFLRQIMKTVTIKDRTRLRQVCRSFESLVANTHAGYFQRATIIPSASHLRRKISISIYIGDELLRIIVQKDELDQFIAHWNRLFSGSCVGDFEYYLGHGSFNLDSIRKLTNKIRIGTMHSSASGNAQLSIAVQLMADFPGSNYAMDLSYLPEPDHLLSLPLLVQLKLSPPGLIPADLLMKLVAAHKDVHLRNVTMTADEWVKILKDLSVDPRKRSIQFEIRCSIIVKCLKHYGISESSKDGDASGEFELVTVRPAQNRIQLRYRNCSIDIGSLDWTSTCWNAELHMTNWK